MFTESTLSSLSPKPAASNSLEEVARVHLRLSGGYISIVSSWGDFEMLLTNTLKESVVFKGSSSARDCTISNIYGEI